MVLFGVYVDDQFQFEGTAEEVSKRLGVKLETVKWYGTPTGMKRQFKRKNPKREIVKLDE